MRSEVMPKTFARFARLCPAPPLGKLGNLVCTGLSHSKLTFAQLAQATFQKRAGQSPKTPLFWALPACPACPPLRGDCRAWANGPAVPRGATLPGYERHAGALGVDGRRSTSRNNTRGRARDRLTVDHYARMRAKPAIVKVEQYAQARARPWPRSMAHRRTPNAIAANCARLDERERARSGSPCPEPPIASGAVPGPPMTFEARRNNQKQARGSR